MELVYLWVEDYKNIKKKGFNFSPRFKCEYDEENKKLEIIDKEKIGESYPKNFFGDNINITALVGENGAGKSNILEILFLPHNINKQLKYIVFFKLNDTIHYYVSFEDNYSLTINGYTKRLH